MSDISFTILKKRANPWLQAIFALVLGWVGMGVCKVLHLTNAEEYFAALVAIIAFTLLNIAVSFGYDSFLRYTVPCWYLYIALVIVLFLSARTLSGVSIWTQYEYRAMLISVTLFYVLASILVRIVKLFYDAANKGL